MMLGTPGFIEYMLSKLIVGIQLADLCGYPCARHILKPNQENRAFKIVKRKIYHKGDVKGWKILP